MFSVVKSFSAAERLDLASQFVRSFPAGTEFLLIGASRDAVDDFVRALTRARPRLPSDCIASASRSSRGWSS
jgi:hypothetical protein